MNDTISLYRGAKDPVPTGQISWVEVLLDIQSGKYKPLIEQARKIRAQNKDSYRAFKEKLPAVTFAGVFSRREKGGILSPTGFIIPDLDHLKNIESVFSLLSQDENIWFVFRSPSGEGLKCGIRAEGIQNDEDHKRLFRAVSRYFSETYRLEIDRACSDISRLTFLSYDPHIFVSDNQPYFDVDAWTQKPVERHYKPVETANGWKEKYGARVLDSKCKEIIQSVPGQQHNTRLRMATLVGGFIAGGYIDEGAALSQLERAVMDSGAENVSAAMKTVRDGIEFGKTKPVVLEEREVIGKDEPLYFNMDEADLKEADNKNVIDVIKRYQSDQSDQSDQKLSNCYQDVIKCYQEPENPATKKPYNLAALIVEFITNSSGSFTADQIDRELCLTTRNEKVNRAMCLNRCIKNYLIEADRRVKGKYHILNRNLDIINIDSVDESPFDVIMPFDLHKYVSIPKKSIIVIAGSSNAGKTSIALNILKLNLRQQFNKLYLMSEMGAGEYVERLKRFDDVKFSDWKKVTAAERSHDFNGAIKHHNPDGLTCIDFLEEVDGEYFKIPTDIRAIYESLNEGIAVIAIQKRTDQEYARGGQATTEKARLYVTVDHITTLDHSIVCALKILKLKRPMQKNLQGHEIHFKIHSGAKIEPLGEWMRSEPGLREKLKVIYEAPNRDKFEQRKDNYAFKFKTETGNIIGVNHVDFSQWSLNYPNIDVSKECKRLSDASFQGRLKLRDKGWIYQILGIIGKSNEACSPRQQTAMFGEGR
jgi:hypothetical protein